RRSRGLQQHRIEQVAAERPAKTCSGSGQFRLSAGFARKEADAADGGTDVGAPRLSDSKPIEKAEIARGYVFSTNLAAWKRTLFDDSDAPSVPCQRQRG